MSDSLMPFFWAAITFPILLFMQRWIHRHLRGVALLLTGNMSWAVLMYAIVLFPGVVLHELSHWLTATLLGVRTASISLLPKMQDDGSIQLGYVEYYKGRTLGPIRESVIGAAPLVVGTAVILLIGFRVFGVEELAVGLRAADIDALTVALGRLFTTPDFLVWLYLLFAIGNAMMPSPSDRRAWPLFLLILVLASLALYVLNLQEILVTGLTGPVRTMFGYLALAFSLAIGVDVMFMLLIATLEYLISRIKGVELVYETVET